MVGRLKEASWFDLSMYDGLSNWSIMDWAHAISRRIAIAAELDLLEAGHPHQESALQYFESHFHSLRDDPIRGHAAIFVSGRRTNLWRQENSEDEPWAISPVNGVATGARVTWLCTTSESALVEVDLSAPDQAIYSCFRKWLQSARTERARIGEVTNADMSSWVECKAIPFIDLSQFLRLKQIRISNARLADILFPDAEVDRVERLRKVTSRVAQKLLSRQHYNTVLGQLGAAGGEPEVR